MEHHSTLSPSKFPALVHCIHYEGRKEDSTARTRGTKIHEYYAKYLANSVGGFPREDIEYAAKGEWLAEETRGILSEIKGIEYRLTILDYMTVPPEELTFGTADAWGYDGTQLTLIDAKTGRQRDYKEQMASYALGLMDETNNVSCKCVILYCDIPSSDIFEFTYSEAADIVFGIVARVNAGTEDPQENSHCGFCAKQPTCPAWTVPARQALAIVQDKTFDLELLKADPVKLGEFWGKWTKAKKLVDDAKLRESALAYLNEDPDSVPGWSVQTVDGRLSYDEDEIEEVLNLIPTLGIDRARTFVKVDQKAFEQAWEKFSKKPIPVVPTQHAGSYQKLIKSKK